MFFFIPPLDTVAHKIQAADGACLTLVKDHDNAISIQPRPCDDPNLDQYQRWFWNGQDKKVRLQGKVKYCWTFGVKPKPRKIVFARCSEKLNKQHFGFNNQKKILKICLKKLF